MRHYNSRLNLANIRFQSTHPRRVRQQHSKYVGLGRCFNPRTHVGCDKDGVLIENDSNGFNPRTHVGCDRERTEAVAKVNEFQSTHPRRVRHGFISMIYGAVEFQSTHPRRVRQDEAMKDADAEEVSIHAPT